MKTHKFARKTFYVDAVRVSEANIQEVAEWCGGSVSEDETGHTFLSVEVHRPLTERQTQAFIGDWVLFAGSGYKVYTPKAFDKSFEKVKFLTKEQADAAGIKPPHEPRPKSEQKKVVHGNKEEGIEPVSDEKKAKFAKSLQVPGGPKPTPPKKRGGTPLTNNLGEKLKEAQAKVSEGDVDYRSAESGRFVSEETAAANPDTTVKETNESSPTAGKTKADIEAEKLIAEVKAAAEGPGN